MPWVAAGLPLGWRQVDSNSRQPNADPAATRVNQKLLGPFVLSASLTNKTSRSFTFMHNVCMLFMYYMYYALLHVLWVLYLH